MKKHASALLTAALGATLAVTAVVPATAGPGDYRVARTAADGAPERWDPCSPIGYKVNPNRMPPGALEEVQEVFRRVSAVNGLQFTYQGATTNVPRPGNVDTSTGIVIVWTPPDEANSYAPSNGSLGVGGFSSRTTYNSTGAPSSQIVAGRVLMNSERALDPGFGPRASNQSPTRGQALLHEIAHALGLAHVENTGEIMNPLVPPQLGGYGAGDRDGLRAVGVRHGCFAATSAGTTATAPPEPAEGPAAQPTPTSTTPASSSSSARVPELSVAPSLVSYGQTAVVTITGDPGSAVDLYTRKYPNADFTMIRSGLVLDGSGRATVPTRPDCNLRFMAKAQQQADPSVTSNQPLMTVRKALTMTARRTGTRTYTFSGAASPYNPGATVAVYRNGALLRGSVPVSSGRAWSVTLSVPAGGASYEVRSGASGYNAASASAPMSMSAS